MDVNEYDLKFWRTSITAIRLGIDLYLNLKMLIFYFLLQLVKQAIMPRVHGLALKTTVAAVRSHYSVQECYGMSYSKVL